MKYYHGTTSVNLTELEPFANRDSNLQKSCVYLTKQRAVAALYIWNKPYRWMTFGFNADGIPVYTESFQNSLREFYYGVSGRIYTCEGDYTDDGKVGIRHVVYSEKPVAIAKCEIVENAYQRILEYERSGEIILNLYDNLTSKQHASNKNMVQNFIKDAGLMQSNNVYAEFVKEKFPKWWEQMLY